MALLSLGKWIGAAALVCSVASCGWYTNVPAQVHIQNVDPATVGVVFGASGAPTFTNPTVTAVGEAGSIGVTYTVASVTYTGQDGKAVSGMDSKLFINLRVEGTSVTPAASTGGAGTVTAGTGKAMLPVVSQPVLDYAKNNKGVPLTAQVVLQGFDDAHFPSTQTLFVPIVFSGL